MEREKPGLKRFYKWETQDEFNQYLSDPVTRGIAMIQKVKERGCPEEVAMSLSLLALYDLVVLIGASSCLFLRYVLVDFHYSLIDSSPCSKMVALTHEI